MNHEVIITCAVTGAGDAAGKHPGLPVTPKQIAAAAIEAARAGAVVAYIQVHNPRTGRVARDPALYREVVGHIRRSDVDAVTNLTAGMGGDFVPDERDPLACRASAETPSGCSSASSIGGPLNTTAAGRAPSRRCCIGSAAG